MWSRNVYQVVFMDKQSSAASECWGKRRIIYQAWTCSRLKESRNYFAAALGGRASIDFEEVIAAPAIFMIISQRFDIEHDMTRRARRGKEGKKGEIERRKYNDAKQWLDGLCEKRQHVACRRTNRPASQGEKPVLSAAPLKANMT